MTMVPVVAVDGAVCVVCAWAALKASTRAAATRDLVNAIVVLL
jgi:hypothetical protein